MNGKWKLVKPRDLMTEFVAAGLFFPVALMFQRAAEQFFPEGRGEGGNLDLATLCFGSLKLMYLLVASMSSVLLLGYAFHASANKRGVRSIHCIGASLLFIFFVTLAATTNAMQLGISGSLLSSYGIVYFFDDDFYEGLAENYRLVGSAMLISVIFFLNFLP